MYRFQIMHTHLESPIAIVHCKRSPPSVSCTSTQVTVRLSSRVSVTTTIPGSHHTGDMDIGNTCTSTVS